MCLSCHSSNNVSTNNMCFNQREICAFTNNLWWVIGGLARWPITCVHVFIYHFAEIQWARKQYKHCSIFETHVLIDQCSTHYNNSLNMEHQIFTGGEVIDIKNLTLLFFLFYVIACGQRVHEVEFDYFGMISWHVKFTYYIGVSEKLKYRNVNHTLTTWVYISYEYQKGWQWKLTGDMKTGSVIYTLCNRREHLQLRFLNCL